MKEYFQVIGLVIAVTCSLFAVIGPVDYYASREACSAKWEHSGMDSHYGFYEGCMLEVVGGKWIPANNVRVQK